MHKDGIVVAGILDGPATQRELQQRITEIYRAAAKERVARHALDQVRGDGDDNGKPPARRPSCGRVENKRIVVSRDPDGVLLDARWNRNSWTRPARPNPSTSEKYGSCLRSSVHDLTMTGIDPPRPAACIEMFPTAGSPPAETCPAPGGPARW